MSTKRLLEQINEDMKKALAAYLCNDLENVRAYEIKGDKMYYNGEFVGEISNAEIKVENDEYTFSVNYKPVKTLEYIDINLIISPTGAILND